MKLTVELPQVGRMRMIATGALCSTATALWIAAPLYLPFATVSWMHVVEGFAIPSGVGWVTLLLMEGRIVRDLQPARRRPQAEPKRRQEVAR